MSTREVSKLKCFISKAKCDITLHTANGATRTEDAANIYVKELDENITPHILDNTPPVLTVGYRCLEMGYTCVWPAGETHTFIRPGGNLCIWLSSTTSLMEVRTRGIASPASLLDR